MAKPNNFILSGKGLVLDLNPKDLDWEMLKFSKTINSKKGGWNFKKYYLDALEGMLTWDNGIFKTITTNTTVPQRMYPFFSGRDNNNETGISDPDPDGENAFERAIYNTYGLINSAELLNISDSKYQVVTYQLPLVPQDGAAFKNIDLLAYDIDHKQIAIIELKKGSNTGDSPLFAIFESMVYFKVLHGNWNLFKEPFAHRLKDYTDDATKNEPGYQILIIAPNAYWNYWGILNKETLSDNGNKIKVLADKIGMPDSTAKCNTLLKNFGRRSIVQAFARSCV